MHVAAVGEGAVEAAGAAIAAIADAAAAAGNADNEVRVFNPPRSHSIYLMDRNA